MKSLKLEGIIPATVLPLTSRHEIDEDSLVEYIRWLAGFGIGGLAVNVDTGEGPHLHRGEKVRVLRAVKEAVGGRVPVIAGLQASFTSQAVEIARETKEAGADGFLVFPISDFAGEPLPPEIPYGYHKAIAEATGVPIVLFQLQKALGGVEYEPECLARLTEIEEVVAIKEASFDALRFLKTLKLVRSASPEVAFLTGNDNFIYESMVMGADGALIGFGTLATDLQVEMFNLVRQSRFEEAGEIAGRVQPLADAIFAPPVRNYRARTKEALVMLGVLRQAHMRPPLTPIGRREREAVREALKKAELL